MLDKESADLLAELKAEFGKKKPGIAPAAGGRKSLPQRTQRTWVSPDGRKHLVATHEDNREPGASRPEDGANAIAHSEAFLAVWQPEARETWVMSQQCRCCTRTTVYIAGEYIRFRRRAVLAFGKYPIHTDKSNSHVWRRTEHFPDLWLLDHTLPRVVCERDQHTAQCAECLRTEIDVDNLWNITQRVLLHEADAELTIPGIDTELPQREAQPQSQVVPEPHSTGRYGWIWPTSQRNVTTPPVQAPKGVIA